MGSWGKGGIVLPAGRRAADVVAVEEESMSSGSTKRSAAATAAEVAAVLLYAAIAGSELRAATLAACLGPFMLLRAGLVDEIVSNSRRIFHHNGMMATCSSA